jgi:hypothetical protein
MNYQGMLSFQDFEIARDAGAIEDFIAAAISQYYASPLYQKAVIDDQYYEGDNPTLMSYFATLEIDGGKKIDLLPKIRISTGIFKRLITLQVNSLWYNGVQLDTQPMKEKLGQYFDNVAVNICTGAAVHSVGYGFWNYDHLEQFTALEYFPLQDERTKMDMAGIRFWSIGPYKPDIIQLYELDGWSEYRRVNGGLPYLVLEKQPYRRTYRSDALGTEIISGENYPGFPVVPLYVNSRHKGEMTTPIRSKIDLYDILNTGFGDQVLRTKLLNWVLEGMSGDVEYLLAQKEVIEKFGIIAPNGDVNAHPELISLPYEAVMNFLAELEKAIFRDAIVTNPQELMGSNLTATAIDNSFRAERLKVSDTEWNQALFVQRILDLIGIKSKTIKFKAESVTSDIEITQRLAMYPDLDMETKLILDPLFPPEMIDDILDRIELQQTAAIPEPPPPPTQDEAGTEQNPENQADSGDE